MATTDRALAKLRTQPRLRTARLRGLWGAQVASDKLRGCARCTVCGHKGATIQLSFPVDQMDPPAARRERASAER
jgi:hypothetical protein